MSKKSLFSTLSTILLMVLACIGCEPDQKATIKTEVTSTTARGKAQSVKPVKSVKSVKSVKPANTRQKQKPQNTGYLTADKAVYDFGIVEPSQKVNGKFVLTNTGRGTLKIKKRIRKSCSCIANIKLNKWTLKPGESADMSFVYTTKSRPGPSSQMFYVDVVPPSLPMSLNLKLIAEVKNVISVKPEKLIFEIRPQAKFDFDLELKSIDGQSFAVTGFGSSSRIVSSSLKARPSATSHTIPVRINPDKVRTSRSGVITVNVDHPKLKSVSVPYSTILPFTAHPPTRAFLRMRKNKAEKTNVKVISNFGEDFEIADITSIRGYIEVLNKVKTEDGYRIDFAFKAPPDAKNRLINDYLVITVKNHPKETIKVPCYGKIFSK